ncbi:MAG TPA: molybdate ABC transporter substrate-binding protein [Burkholderiales bacterium]|nr:molybdate ABC transporter substrate-binding protein [Burkholderiales bacterium]
MIEPPSFPIAAMIQAAVPWRRIAFVLLASMVILGAGPSRAQDIPVVAAAADLKFALEEIAGAFTQTTGRSVKLAFGSSGNFRRQIAEGAPFQIYMSADEAFVFAVAKEGRTLDEGTLYAIGRIVIFVPNGSPLKPDPELRDLAAGIADGRVKKFAIANPEHAPYGRAAQQALIRAGLWDKIADRIVLGENVSQAAQFAASGSAQGGIIALSLARAPSVSKLGQYALLPAESHDPLRQRMVLLKGAGDTAKAFYQFVQQPQARAIFKHYGFLLPGE